MNDLNVVLETMRDIPLPERVRTWREARGLGQGDLAKALGVSQAAVSRWEAGLRKPPAFLWLAIEQVALRADPSSQSQS